MKFTHDEIFTAILQAAPEEGQQWDPEVIASKLVNLVNAEVDETREAQAAWEEGRKDFAVRFVQSDVAKGDPSSIRVMREEAVRAHRELIDARVRRNVTLINGIGAAVIGMGSIAMSGGATSPAFFSSAYTIAKQIASALNDTTI